MNIWQQISSTFWSPSFWLPNNITWDDIASSSQSSISYADYKDLFWSLPIAIALFAIRYCSENYIFCPFGQSLGVKSTPCSKQPVPNRILELAYLRCNRLNERTKMALTKQMDTMTQREIERWWRLRRAQDKPTLISKFCESLWRCLYYACSFSFGLFVLWSKPWLWDIEQSWFHYPHSIDNGVWLYYTVSLSLYLSLCVSQFTDVKRKDFWMMFAHHIATILAISLSWISHFHRIGSLVLLYHDFADIFLELCKVAKYAKYHRLCDILMAIFIVVWIVSRLILYPRLLYSTFCELQRIGRLVPFILFGLLLLLQCMHILWTYWLFQIIRIALKTGSVEDDSRSSSGSCESLSESENNENRDKSEKMHHR